MVRSKKNRPELATRFTEDQIRQIAHAGFPKASAQQINLLEQRLNDQEIVFCLLSTLGAGGTPTDRHVVARNIRVRMEKSLQAEAVDLKSLSADQPFYGVLLYDFASTLSTEPETLMREGDVPALLLRALENAPASILALVRNIESQANQEKAANNLKTKRERDQFLDLLFMSLMTIYEEVFKKFAATYAESHSGSRGPLSRYLEACFRHLGLRPISPAAIRKRVRRLSEARLSGEANYDHGFNWLEPKPSRKQKRPGFRRA